MRVEEAAWIGRHAMGSPVLELASSTGHFRTVSQPHIDAMIHAPLRARGVTIVHADLKAAPGVDIVGDFTDPVVQAELIAVKAQTVLCCNLFEHVLDRDGLVELCDRVLQPGGLLIVTVPYSVPFHNDPIDTYFRPSPAEIAALFPDYKTETAEVVESTTFGQDLVRSGASLPLFVVKSIWRLIPIWRGWKTYQHMNHRLLWLFRPYKMSCVALRKPV